MINLDDSVSQRKQSQLTDKSFVYVLAEERGKIVQDIEAKRNKLWGKMHSDPCFRNLIIEPCSSDVQAAAQLSVPQVSTD